MTSGSASFSITHDEDDFEATLACFFKLEKVYNPENEEDDMVEMEEERLRMREHVMNEVSRHSSTTCTDLLSCLESAP